MVALAVAIARRLQIAEQEWAGRDFLRQRYGGSPQLIGLRPRTRGVYDYGPGVHRNRVQSLNLPDACE
jgi:hypothetical protein